MATATVRDILDAAQLLLQDTEQTRWDDDELMAWLSTGINLFIDLKPSINARFRDVTLVAGPQQNAGAATAKILKFVSNVVGAVPTRPVTPVTLDMLNAEIVDWSAEPTAALVMNYTLSPDNRREFWVYPPQPANTTTLLRGELAEYVDAITDPDATLPIDGEYRGACVDYVVSRMLSKDGDDGANAERAELHYSKAVESITARRRMEREE